MIITMDAQATAAHIGAVFMTVQSLGGTPYAMHSNGHPVIVGIGIDRSLAIDRLAALPGVEDITDIKQPYKLASRAAKAENSRVQVGNVCIGGPEIIIIAGLHSVESREQLLETAWAVQEAGGKVLCGSLATSPMAPAISRAARLRGLELLAEARQETGLPIMAEVITPESVPMVAEYADILQIGAGNMQNYALLHAVGRVQRPVVLKRGMMNDVQEWLMAAEYILSSGNNQVILAEGGIRTFEKMTRRTFDLAVVPLLKKLTHLPVIADPSHATGRWDLVPAIARAAIAAGADGLFVEVRSPYSEGKRSEDPQSLDTNHFAEMIVSLRLIARALGRTLS